MPTSEISLPAPEQVLRNRHEANGNRCVAHTHGRPTANEPSYQPGHSAVKHNLLSPPPTGTIHS